jgi:hypothetical protein
VKKLLLKIPGAFSLFMSSQTLMELELKGVIVANNIIHAVKVFSGSESYDFELQRHLQQ